MQLQNSHQLLNNITSWAQQLGITKIGVANPKIPQQLKKQYLSWLGKNYHGNMEYMQRKQNLLLRFDPSTMLENCHSVIMLSINYWSKEAAYCQTQDSTKANIALYALGRDYHKVVRKILKDLGKKISAEIGEEKFTYRIFCDSAPVLERYFAAQAGLGFIGKNGMLIDPQNGSYLVLGGIYTNLELPTNTPIPNRCGKCTRCLDACPTKALIEPQILDARRCISYQTIENKDAIDPQLKAKFKNQLFGCDCCQKVCPWNRFAKATTIKDFNPREQFCQPQISQLKTWDEKTFLAKTEGTALRRLKWRDWQRNLTCIEENS